MWEALGPIIRWPLYSPRRFIGVVVAVLAAVFLAGEVNDGATESAATTAVSSASQVDEAPSASAVPTRSAIGPATSGDSSYDSSTQDPAFAAADAAASLVAAWARPDLSAEAWSAGVRPLVTNDLWSNGLSMTDPASTPEVAVRGEPRQVAMNAEEAVLDVPTTGAWVRVRVVVAPDGEWLASSVEPAE
ncbi:hypothetical protein GXP71_00455 [Cellulomonas sp. H30R-01]|uniref:hypothetical protein n=1 Tax=Cellulomonas sp. H30R-01 TaxID=2704467 RepID=UPI00138B2902|nr:hypothetical protein [Cellulomonas sp. H30R-01]QHT54721.1 hypothetical protein GXP71_00455 [Cellulomonas sp. H30R-01]